MTELVQHEEVESGDEKSFIRHISKVANQASPVMELLIGYHLQKTKTPHFPRSYFFVGLLSSCAYCPDSMLVAKLKGPIHQSARECEQRMRRNLPLCGVRDEAVLNMPGRQKQLQQEDRTHAKI
ncbi:unnamed protein product [Lepidochelys kempii]